MKRFQIALLTMTLTAAIQAAEPPVIRAMMPENGAANFGQMITVQGFGLAPVNRPTVIFTPGLGGDDITCNFIYTPVSTDNELYVRLTLNGCSVPVGTYLVRVRTVNGESEAFAYDVKFLPATPIARSLCDPSQNGCPAVTSIQRGQKLVVFGYGLDTSGAIVDISQGNNKIQLSGAAITAVSVPGKGLGAMFTVPASLNPGLALVQLRTFANASQTGPSLTLPINLQ